MRRLAATGTTKCIVYDYKLHNFTEGDVHFEMAKKYIEMETQLDGVPNDEDIAKIVEIDMVLLTSAIDKRAITVNKYKFIAVTDFIKSAATNFKTDRVNSKVYSENFNSNSKTFNSI